MLLERLKEVEDPRSYHGREYLLHHILYFTVLALLSNAKTYSDVARFIKGHFERLKTLFGLKWRRAPDETAIRKILVRLDPASIEAVFRDDAAHQAQTVEPGACRHICFDGKSLRGSFSHVQDKRAEAVFSAFSACQQVVLAHIALGDDKGHEIPALQAFLLSLNLRDVIVTADAMHCQKKHSRARGRRERS